MTSADLPPGAQDVFTQGPAGSLCHSSKPYPVPKGLARNIRYARILQYAYSAGSSELTSIHQYTYHAIATEQEAPELSRTLRSIAAVELHHLHMLGQCILQLGLLPTFGYYQGTRRARWNSGFVQYARHPKGVIELCIQTEAQALEYYLSAIERISDEQVVALLHRLIEDEEEHIRALEELREK